MYQEPTSPQSTYKSISDTVAEDLLLSERPVFDIENRRLHELRLSTCIPTSDDSFHFPQLRGKLGYALQSNTNEAAGHQRQSHGTIGGMLERSLPVEGLSTFNQTALVEGCNVLFLPFKLHTIMLSHIFCLLSLELSFSNTTRTPFPSRPRTRKT